MKISFVGIGTMGWGMASNLLRGGHDLGVFDTDRERATKFAKEVGGRQLDSLFEAGLADVVFLMLPSSAVVREVLIGAEGLIAKMRPGGLLIDMGTSDPNETRSLEPLMLERGIRFIDAPVSGGHIGAASGKLAIMYGSNNAEALDIALPLLQLLGDRLFPTGALGSGHAVKVLNNFLAAAHLAAAVEMVRLAEGFGLDLNRVLDTINSSSGRSLVTEYGVKSQIIEKQFSSGFPIGLMAKDVGLAASMSEVLELDLPIVKLSSKLCDSAAESLGYGADCGLALFKNVGGVV